MSFKRFNPTCPCCCFKNLAVICIYDESESIYTTGGTYLQDYEQWSELIDSLKKSTILMGVLQPQGSKIKGTGDDYLDPYDSVGPFLHVQIPNQSPRVKASDIIGFFEDLRGSLKINLLVFCLDNSGSIVTSSYASELASAKTQLKETYPNLKILDDVSNSGERWLRDAFVSADKRTCG